MSDPLEPYWFALGKFVHRYAQIESTLHQVLRIVSNCSERTAKVLFSGTRVIGAKDIILRFYKAKSQVTPEHLNKAFSRLGDITKARDRLLHYGLQFEGGKAIVTDELRNVGQRAFKHSVSTADLDNLEADSTTIHACLVCFWIEERRADLIDSPSHIEWLRLAGSAWCYKPPKPIRPRNTIRASVRERKPSPRSLGE